MVIRSLLEPTWGKMKLVLTHSENIKTFADISRHLELEAECIGVYQNTLLVAQFGQRRHSGLNTNDKGGMPKKLVT